MDTDIRAYLGIEEKTKTYDRSYQAAVSNATGRLHEDMIRGGCAYYMREGLAKIEKVPEPFRTLKKTQKGKAQVQFTARAEPDFIGTLKGGRTIVFEAKATTTDRIHLHAITPTQAKSLDTYMELGARAGVCVGLEGGAYFVPWEVYKNMKIIYGHQYMTATELEAYRVRMDRIIYFLHPVQKRKG